jgi:hypothetical protein
MTFLLCFALAAVPILLVLWFFLEMEGIGRE